MNNFKRFLAIPLLFSIIVTVFAAAPEVTYISPNNDGIQDELNFPIKISDKLYIKEWSFIITDTAGVPVRTMANKEKRPDPPTGFISWVTSFWKRLTTPKQGVDIPDFMRWDGTLDSGETAPDGTYFYYITASDDNGNTAKTESLTAVVDNTAPELTVEPPESDTASDADMLIFSPDGDGQKDTITFAQSGSIEDLWEGAIVNAAGAVVRSFRWTASSPADAVWDGRSDIGPIAPDGVYSYTVVTTDRAGNKREDRIDNIILNTDKPSINISISENAFSPNGDGVKDSIALTPSIPITSGLENWILSIIDSKEQVQRSFSGGETVPAQIEFDGKNSGGSMLVEGSYQAVLNASYNNGYQPVSRSPLFTLDVTPPQAVIRAGEGLFSPNGDLVMDTVQIFQDGSAQETWTGTITDAQGQTVRSWTFSQNPPASVVWDGMTDTRVLGADGVYSYKITSTDRAGNTGTSNAVSIRLDTEGTDVILTANQTAFSPNGDGVQDSVVFSPIVKTSGTERYSLTISDSAGTAVRTFNGTSSVPASISWNGLADDGVRVADGIYTALLEVVSRNGTAASSAAPPFAIDTVYPSVDVSAPYLLFSPNGDSNKDGIPVNLVTSTEELWTGEIRNARNEVIRSFNWEGQAQGFEWDASDEAGNMVEDGTYRFAINASDAAGNRTQTELTGITIDARTPKAFFTSSQSAFSPNGDSVKDSQRLSILTTIPEGIESWQASIVSDDTGNTVKRWSREDTPDLPASIDWDGRNDAGVIVEGRFHAALDITYAKGDVINIATPSFIATVTPPQLTVRMTPRYFSPDNDGVDDDLFISLKAVTMTNIAQWSFEITAPTGTPFWRTEGANAITERLIWDGRSNKGELVQAATDYPFTFTVTDDHGMTSTVTGIIPVDVLVIRVGDVLKIQVPSIIFRENAADFETLAPEVVEKNNFVLKRVAEILNKFKDYRVTVEGHANNVTGTEREEVNELVPLSELRANAVRTILSKNGVDISRLSAVGRGGRLPVAARDDRENWWKNRRVEFILEK
jgi:outer membrane protein OmpA-like peptidoglycan-associated protein/flagellar hook assembly protein FlgD